MQSLFIKKQEKNSKKPRSYFTAGFTLLELIVTITIFVVVTSAILIRNSKFKNDQLITNLAYEMALSIREAQTYGINVKENALNPNYNYAYGIHFGQGIDNVDSQFILFIDGSPENKVFDSGEEEGTVFNLRGGNAITSLCVYISSWDCNKDSLDITFKRPDPEAQIRAGGISEAGISYKKAQIHINSNPPETNTERVIEVHSTGQISVLSF